MALLDTEHKKKSFTLTTLLLSILLLVMFYIGLTYMDPPIENGITINFGTTEFGSGRVQPKEKIRAEPVDEPMVEPSKQEEVVVPVEESPTEETPQQPAETSEKVLTQDSEESIRIKQQQERQRKEALAQQRAREAAEAKKAAELAAKEQARKEQEAKRKRLDAMMGGLNKSDGTASGSEGDDALSGDKGDPAGDPYANSYYGAPGSGTGTGGDGLKNRYFIGAEKVLQECNESGTVVVKIVVDRNGKVIRAEPGERGTTNKHPCLLEPARKTAMLHRWKPDPEAPSQQTGFVVVNFKLGE
ncbi:energy transducer TonB [Maribacter sp. 2307ULW6-5]|uniref:energy transducer TonB n=1 Tax=Maribacter sp. 2307ULW6-5 TaxID=3386275 RepID=UPI0039BCB719